MRVLIALFALLVVGASAQDFSHFIGGSFTAGDNLPSGSLARWDMTSKRWFQTGLSTALNVGGAAYTILDIEVGSGNEIIYLLVRVGSVFRVVSYDNRDQSFLNIGDEINSAGASANDIAIIGDRLYICGDFNLPRPRVDTDTPLVPPRPEIVNVINVGYVSLGSTNRPLWTQIEPSTNATTQQPACSKIFSMAGRLMMITGSQLAWRLNNFDWTTDPVLAGSNLRASTVGGGVNAASSAIRGSVMVGTRLFLTGSSTSNTVYRRDGDVTSDFVVVYSDNGLDFQGALRINTAGTTQLPGVDSIFWDATHLAVIGNNMYFAGGRVNNSRNLWSFYTAPISADQVVPTKVGAASSFIGQTSNNQAGNPVQGLADGASMWVDNGRIYFVCSYNTECYNYTEVSFVGSENNGNDVLLYRAGSRLGQILSFDPASGVYATEFGGGLNGLPTKVVKGAGGDVANSFWCIGTFDTVYNKRWLGLAGYNRNTKQWVSLGDPLRDVINFPGGYDSAGSIGGSFPAGTTSTINTVHTWADGANAYVVVAGTFRRIYNSTYNGIAWMRTDQIGVWNPLGSIGLHELVADHTYLVQRSAGIVSSVRPGVVNAIASTGGSATRTLWIGGRFFGSGNQRGDLFLNNIAKYTFGSSNTFSPLGGGVNAEVFAVDAVGNNVYVGGDFTRCGNLTASFICMWDDDKKTWNIMGTGISGAVRQIIARSANEVYVVSVPGAHASGVASKQGNLHRWDGSKWNHLDCACDQPSCRERDNYASCIDATAELRFINGRIVRRTTGGAIQYAEGWNKWRSFGQSTFGAPAVAYLDLMSSPVSGGDRILIGRGANTLTEKYSASINELDVGDFNVYPVTGSGFANGQIAVVSSASAFAPVMAFVAFVAAIVLFF